MWLGIDVGGTFTDAVVIANGEILAQAKAPTTHTDLLSGILAAVDLVMHGMVCSGVERVALSTTIVTNAVVQGKTDTVGLLLLPGPGVNLNKMLPELPITLAGYVDHRGRETSLPDEKEVIKACEQLQDRSALAVVGKFAVRNPRQELQVARWVKEQLPGRHVTAGSSISGALNFWRRTNSAYYNSAVHRHFGEFSTAITTALQQRQITAPVFVLKADGGTLPLVVAEQNPVETIFTGPAASVLGIMAMTAPSGETVSLDVGGTTTDIALWQDGLPLFASRGARINGFPTAVRAFWMRSVGIGGDSFVRWEGEQIKVGPMRLGPAMALGGEYPTVSDALIVAGHVHFGDRAAAMKAMEKLTRNGGSSENTAALVLEAAATIIHQEIDAMILEQAAEPVYKVDDIINGRPIAPELLIGVGGAAPGLAPLVAKIRGIDYQTPPGAMVANAVGAAVARPTTEVTLRADTSQGIYTVAELGLRQKLTKRSLTPTDVRDLARQHLRERAVQSGINFETAEVVYEEEFNLVRGFSTIGKILTCRLQVKPGVLRAICGKEGVL
ncbi:MAG: apc3 [Firmicutes bacterium]|nr:apc3 [Bacillota bacterium]